jgi:hypothetical protein
MAHTYEQSTGRWLDPDGALLTVGYSGNGAGLNNPGMQMVHDTGPLPEGVYLIGPPTTTVRHGPDALPLTPDAANQMYGRSDFMVHGDEVLHPGMHLASDGCIIMSRSARDAIWASGDRQLSVVANAVLTPRMVVTDPDISM